MYRPTRHAMLSLIAGMLVCLGALHAQEIPPNIQRYIDRAEAQRKVETESLSGEIRELEQQIKELPRQGLDRRQRRARSRELRSRIEDLESKLDQLKKAKLPTPTIDPFRLSSGQIGRLYGGKTDSFKVLSVIGKDRVLVLPYRVVTKIYFIGLESKQRFEEESGEPLMFVGISTSGLVDDRAFLPRGVFEVTGTEQYTTVTGAAATVFRLEPFDVDQIEPFIPKVADKQKEQADKPQERLRQWTDASGEYRIVARFVKVEGTDVVLEKRDGERITLPLEKLSKRDQQWIADDKGFH